MAPAAKGSTAMRSVVQLSRNACHGCCLGPSVKPRTALQLFHGAVASCGNCWLYSNRLFLVAYAVHLVTNDHCCHGVDQLVSVKLLVGIN